MFLCFFLLHSFANEHLQTAKGFQNVCFESHTVFPGFSLQIWRGFHNASVLYNNIVTLLTTKTRLRLESKLSTMPQGIALLFFGFCSFLPMRQEFCVKKNGRLFCEVSASPTARHSHIMSKSYFPNVSRSYVCDDSSSCS